MTDWHERSLAEVLDVRHGYAFKGEGFGQGGSHRLVTPGNFYERGGFRDRGPSQKSYEGPVPSEFVLAPGALVIAMTEQAPGLLGSSGLIPHDDNTWLHNQRVGLVRVRDGAAEERFLYYLLNGASVRRQIEATATGTKVRHTAPGRIQAVKVRMPDARTQQRIASLLSAFDELIEINERRIALLEDLARSLYREWFVHFRFPGHAGMELVGAELGLIPEGWELQPLADLARSLTDGDWIETKDQGGSDYRLLQVSNVGLGAFRETGKFRYISEETFIKLRCTAIEEGDLLISRMPDPIGRAWLADQLVEPAVTAVDVAILRPLSSAVGAYLNLWLNSPPSLAMAEAAATGTTRKRISRSVLAQLKVPLPPLESLLAFETAAAPLRRHSNALRSATAHLGDIRDLLLPRLVTGRLDISDIDLDGLLPGKSE
jgi:type I restriction enzyme S subunit